MTDYIRYHDGLEQKQENEDEVIDTIVASMMRASEKVFDKHRHAKRDAHAKSHGILVGHVSVYDNLPAHLAQGVFARPATYPVVIRLSTAFGDIHSDKVPVARGMAIKMLGVPSRQFLPSRQHASTQDLLLVNHPVIAFGHAAAYLKTQKLLEKHADDPDMVRRIVAGGHELASHGYGHLRASDQSLAEFTDDITHSKKLLEDIGGQVVRGYRAPSFSIGTGNLWALDALHDAGYRYSSSIYPILHDHYGMPDAPRFAFYPNGTDGLLEVPITTVQFGQRKLPAGGGGYFRLLPYALSRWMMRRVNQVDRQSAIFYFHPWELDPGQPRPPGASAKTRFRHYVNLDRMEGRIKLLTRDFAWDRMDRIFLGTQ